MGPSGGQTGRLAASQQEGHVDFLTFQLAFPVGRKAEVCPAGVFNRHAIIGRTVASQGGGEELVPGRVD